MLKNPKTRRKVKGKNVNKSKQTVAVLAPGTIVRAGDVLTLFKASKPIAANASFEQELSPREKDVMYSKIAEGMSLILGALGIDHDDHNTKDTPGRFAKMLIEETFAGRFSAPPKITQFDNVHKYDQLITCGNIAFHSTCAHHMLPFSGYATISVLPNVGKNSKVLGLSKYPRVFNWFARRPQIQEELTKQVADHLEQLLKPRGLGVRVVARHLCACVRGVQQENMHMTTTELRGALLTDKELRAEFLNDCNTSPIRSV